MPQIKRATIVRIMKRGLMDFSWRYFDGSYGFQVLTAASPAMLSSLPEQAKVTKVTKITKATSGRHDGSCERARRWSCTRLPHSRREPGAASLCFPQLH